MPTDAALETAPRAKRARREKSTRRSVLIADKVADWTITVGGLGVIVAVFGIMAFLVNVVIPLFTGGSVEGLRSVAAQPQLEGRLHRPGRHLDAGELVAIAAVLDRLALNASSDLLHRGSARL